jgi:hypothetical protein
MKNTIKNIGIGAGIVLSSLLPMKAQALDAHVNTLTNKEGTELRAGLAAEDAFKLNFKTDGEDFAGHLRVSTPDGSEIWTRGTSDGHGAIGLSTSIKGQFLFPGYVQFDNDGNMTYSILAIGGFGSDSSRFDYGLAPNFVEGEGNDNEAFYAGYRNENLGVAVAKHYDDAWRADVGFTAGDFGGLVDYKTDLEGNWKLSLFGAQNPGAVTSPKGPKIAGDVFVIGEFPETSTYLSSTANKSKGGLAGRFAIDQDNAGAAELGYNFGNGLTVTGGSKFDSEGELTTTGALSYTNGGFFGEANFTGGEDPEATLYFSVK